MVENIGGLNEFFGTSKPKSGFSVACQGPRSIEQMTKSTEIVSEAIVVDVSPARDNVYAVTLQVSYYQMMVQLSTMNQ